MFHWMEARAFCHATEDEERVLAAMKAVLPGPEVARETIQGHFGNPIVSLTARTKLASEIRDSWQRIADALGRDNLWRELPERIDEDFVLHLRLDKQQAYLGLIAKGTGDDVIAVRAKVAAYPKKREVAEAAVRAFLEVP